MNRFPWHKEEHPDCYVLTHRGRAVYKRQHGRKHGIVFDRLGTFRPATRDEAKRRKQEEES